VVAERNCELLFRPRAEVGAPVMFDGLVFDNQIITLIQISMCSGLAVGLIFFIVKRLSGEDS